MLFLTRSAILHSETEKQTVFDKNIMGKNIMGKKQKTKLPVYTKFSDIQLKADSIVQQFIKNAKLQQVDTYIEHEIGLEPPSYN